jgi:alpha-amylase
MKRSALALLLVPAMASADWSAPGFPAFQAEGTVILP